MRVFVAGAAGAIGQQLLPLLIAQGHEVTATTRSPGKTALLRQLGAEPVVVDGLDAAAVGEAVARAEPEVIIHQMTSLAGRLRPAPLRPGVRGHQPAAHRRAPTICSPRPRPRVCGASSRRATPAGRTPASGGPVQTEDDPLDPDPPAAQRESLAAIRHLEQVVLAARRLEGIVLRYGIVLRAGRLRRPRRPDPEAQAADHRRRRRRLVVPAHRRRGHGDRRRAGAREPGRLQRRRRRAGAGRGMATVSWPGRSARRRRCRVPVWLGRLVAGEVGVSMMTQIRGSSNAKAKRELGWQPALAELARGLPRGLSGRRAAARRGAA